MKIYFLHFIILSYGPLCRKLLVLVFSSCITYYVFQDAYQIQWLLTYGMRMQMSGVCGIISQWSNYVRKQWCYSTNGTEEVLSCLQEEDALSAFVQWKLHDNYTWHSYTLVCRNGMDVTCDWLSNWFSCGTNPVIPSYCTSNRMGNIMTNYGYSIVLLSEVLCCKDCCTWTSCSTLSLLLLHLYTSIEEEEKR